jgi:hypothetical protein
MKEKTSFVVTVVTAWLLIVGGVCLAGWLAPSRAVYPILLVACLVPAMLLMKLRVPISWFRFGVGVSLLILVGLVLAILRRLQMANGPSPMIVLGLAALAGLWLNKKELQSA